VIERRREAEGLIYTGNAKALSSGLFYPTIIVLMLSLDISGAYNNVPHKRLLYIPRVKGFLE